MLKAHLVLAVLWIVYCVLHSMLAALPVKRSVEHLIGKGFKYYRLAYSVFSLAGLIALLLYQLTITTVWFFKPTFIIQLLGIVISAGGLFIMIICIKKYFMQLSGLRWLTDHQHESTLMLDTIHRRVRHPLYLGTFLFTWGLLLIVPVLSLLVATIIITLYTLIGIRFEEKKLLLEFGESYSAYQRTVPMIIPRLR